MKKAIIAAALSLGAITLGAITGHADPASHRSLAGLSLSHPEWYPSLTLRGNEITVILPQNLLDTAERIGIGPDEVLKEHLEEVGPEMCDNPELARPHKALLLHYGTQDLHISRAADGGFERKYVTVTDPKTGKIVLRSAVIHDYWPRPVVCVLPVPTS